MPLNAAWTTPAIEIQELAIGNTFTGAAANGTLDAPAVGAPYFAGRIKYTGGCTTAGLFGPSPALQGYAIGGVMFVGAGTTNFVLSIKQTLFPAAVPVAQTYKLIDLDHVGYQDNEGGGAARLDPESFVFYFRHPIFVLPGAELQVVTTGNLTAVGRCSLMFTNGWGIPPLAAID